MEDRRRGEEGGGRDGHLYARLSVGVGGGTQCPATGDLQLAAGLVFSSMLHCMSEQRSEAHFYTLLGRLPCQSSPCWQWNGFLLLESQHTVPENRHERCRYKSPLSGQVVMVHCLPFR